MIVHELKEYINKIVQVHYIVLICTHCMLQCLSDHPGRVFKGKLFNTCLHCLVQNELMYVYRWWYKGTADKVNKIHQEEYVNRW